MRFVDSIREVLGFKAECGPCMVERTFLSFLLLKPVSSIELHARLVCIDIHRSAALLGEDLRGKSEVAADMGETPVMVVSMSHDKLVEILIDPIPDHMEIREIHRSSLYRADLSSWDRCLIGRGVKICKNSSFVVKDGTSVIAENLAKSIVIEAAELLECFQWNDEEYDLQHVKEELADVIVYSQNLLDKLGLDADEIVNMKMGMNERKYPVEKAKGKSAKYDCL